MLTVGVGQASNPTGKLAIDGCVLGYFEDGRFLLADGITMEMAWGIANIFFHPTGSPRPVVFRIPRIELAAMVEQGQDVAITTGIGSIKHVG